MPPRKVTVDGLLASFKSLSPAEQDAFLLAVRKLLSPSREFLLGVDMVGDPNGAFREMLRAGISLYQSLRRHHKRTVAERNAELVALNDAGKSYGTLAKEYGMKPGTVAKAVAGERKRIAESQATDSAAHRNLPMPIEICRCL